MPSRSLQVPSTEVVSLLLRWLSVRLNQDRLEWLQSKRDLLLSTGQARTLFTAFSSVSRQLGKADLELSKAELEEAEDLCNGWLPVDWSTDQCARTLLLLSFPNEDPELFQKILDRLFVAADVGEATALYQSLPLLPFPEKHQLRAAEGIRSNMTAVFHAVAFNNPYPANHLDENSWNQMILKALFIGSPLLSIVGLEDRNNPRLANMLVDYARERHAAHRSTPQVLWDLVSSFENDIPHLSELKASCI